MSSGNKTLRIGHLSTIYHTAFILKGTDLLEKQDVTTQWTLFPSGPDIISAMQEQKIDLAYIGLPPVIIGIDRGLSLACIAGGHIEGTVMIAGTGVRSLAECRNMPDFLSQFSGKAIGTPPKGSIHDVIINELLQEHGIRDVSITNYPWADFLPDALQNNEITAAAGTPALAVTAARYGSARLVVPASQLWPFNPSYGIVVMRRMLKNTEPLRKFLEVHEAACEMIRHDPRSAARIVAETTGMVNEEFVLAAYCISPNYCAALPSEYVVSTMKFAKTLQALGYVSQVIREEDIFDRTLIDMVHPGTHHYRSGLNA
ncbi:MAG: NMT1/THI5 like protein [Methanoregula sp. PtaU1.Bin051]|nr:MAG: NMT1/THI5 like protein [Methanoregula sp. PtaU1.Bin051]